MPTPSAEPRSADRGAGTPLAIVTRGEFVESTHRGHLLVAFEDGRHWAAPGSDPDFTVVCRSAIKSLQALPLLESGAEPALSAADLALVVASHEGTDRHVAAVRDLLARHGLREDDLPCGPHAPFDAATRRAMLRAGTEPARAHNNCSGKHAGFLLLARALGCPASAAVDPEAEPQRRVRTVVADMAEVPENAIGVAVDGCGAPTLTLPLVGIARAFANLMRHARADRAPDTGVRARACRRIRDAITDEPFLMAGEKRLCTALLRAFPGRVWPKNGAEGVYACGVRRRDGRAAGLVVKVEDGATRGYESVVVHAVCALLGESLPPALSVFAERPVGNTRGETVGGIRLAPTVAEALAELARAPVRGYGADASSPAGGQGPSGSRRAAGGESA